jgi:hypothetical protein
MAVSKKAKVDAPKDGDADDFMNKGDEDTNEESYLFGMNIK